MKLGTGKVKKVYQANQGGQSLVEFALMLPLLILILMGTFDLGRVFFGVITITNAAREGARYGTLHPGDFTGMRNEAVLEANNSGIPITTANVVVSCPSLLEPPKCDREAAIVVTVNYSFDLVMGWLIPSPIHISRSIEMMVP